MRAQITYLVPGGRAPQVDLTAPGYGTGLTNDLFEVEIAGRDANAADPPGDLAARGFTAVPFSGASLGDVADAAWRGAFAKAVSGTVKKLVGAQGIAVMTNTVTIRRGQGEGAESALPLCHSDFTAASAASKFAQLIKLQPALRNARRFAAYNAWWPATQPPYDRPLALCDATTVSPSDLLPTPAVVHNPAGQAAVYGEVGLYRYNPRHRWSWYPGLTPGHLLVFAGHDSDPRFASQVPHGAFFNPDCPPGTPARASVECRLFAYW